MYCPQAPSGYPPKTVTDGSDDLPINPDIDVCLEFPHISLLQIFWLLYPLLWNVDSLGKVINSGHFVLWWQHMFLLASRHI